MRRFERASEELIHFKVMRKAIFVLLMVGARGWAQQPKVRPDFKDFTVERIYTGAPATPKLSQSQRYLSHHDFVKDRNPRWSLPAITLFHVGAGQEGGSGSGNAGVSPGSGAVVVLAASLGERLRAVPEQMRSSSLSGLIKAGELRLVTEPEP
jgi:hypothetical protein